MARKLILRATNHWPNAIADIIAEYSVYTIEEKIDFAISRPADAERLVNGPDLRIGQFGLWEPSGQMYTIVYFPGLDLSWVVTKEGLIKVVSMQSWTSNLDSRRLMEPKILGALNAWMDTIQ